MKDYTKLKPIGEKIVLRRVDLKTMHGAIHVPDQYQQRAPEGYVLAVGTGPKKEDDYFWEVGVGDHLLLKQYGGTELDKDHTIISVNDVLGLLVNNGQLVVPINRNIIVRMMPPEERASALIHLPDYSKVTQEFGVVVDVAEKCKVIESDDYVFIHKNQGTHYRVGGQDFLIVDERKIHATVPTANAV